MSRKKRDGKGVNCLPQLDVLPLRLHEQCQRMATVTLPEEIVVDILSRLPVKSLIKFKCVCKSWLSLISSRQFAKMHLHHAVTGAQSPRMLVSYPFTSVNYEMLVDRSYEEAIIYLDDPLPIRKVEEVKLLASCHGLIVFSKHAEIYVWNPSTKLFWQLPKPNSVSDDCLYGLGYDSKSDDYKLLRYGYFIKDDALKFVFDVLPLRTNTWRKPQDKSAIGLLNGAGIYLNTAVHWSDGFRSIVSFDMANENFQKFASLPDSDQNVVPTRLGVHQGCLLASRCPGHGPLEAWLMKEYGVESSWTKLFRVSGDGLPWLDQYIFSKLIAITGRGNIVVTFDSKIVLYDLQNEKYEKLPIRNTDPWLEAVVYMESLISPFDGSNDC